MSKNVRRNLIIIFTLIEIIVLFIFSYFHYKGGLEKIGFIIFRHLLIAPLLGIIILGLLYRKNLFNTLMLISFIIILIADTVLPINFIAGLGIFLICHIINGINFTKTLSKWDLRYLIVGFLIYAGVILIYILLFNPHLGSLMRVITIVYMLVISYATFRAVLFIGNFPLWGALSVGLGATLFLICDIEVAYWAFVDNPRWLGVLNDFTYYSGLWLLAMSTSLLWSNN